MSPDRATIIAAVETAFASVDELTYRRATGADRDLERSLVASTLDALLAHLPDEARVQIGQFQADAQTSGDAATFPAGVRWIIERAREPVGRVWIDGDAERLYLVDLVIDPAAQGGGIGSRTIAALFDVGDALGIPVTLQVAVGNPGARRLYDRLGFTATFDGDAHVTMQRLPR